MIADALDNILGARNAIVTGVVVAALTFPLGYCEGQRSANAKNDAARAVANTETMKVDGAAKEIAANERRIDDALVNENTERLLDAVQQAPNSVPDAARVQLGCERLRAQGTPDATIPAVCGS